MTTKEFNQLEQALIKAGYSRCNHATQINGEDFYFYKSTIIFLVYDLRKYEAPGRAIPESSAFGVTPLILTESDEWPRIDLSLTGNVTPEAIKSVEDLARRFNKFLKTKPNIT